MARVFAYLMQPEVEMSDEAIFNDVSVIIEKALAEVHSHDQSQNYISGNALDIALKKLIA
jgi:hypothetical protein